MNSRCTDHVKTVAPVFIFIGPYMAYLTAEMLHLSSIIAWETYFIDRGHRIAVCGMCMKQYVKENITSSATVSVKYFTKMLAGCAEMVCWLGEETCFRSFSCFLDSQQFRLIITGTRPLLFAPLAFAFSIEPLVHVELILRSFRCPCPVLFAEQTKEEEVLKG